MVYVFSSINIFVWIYEYKYVHVMHTTPKSRILEFFSFLLFTFSKIFGKQTDIFLQQETHNLFRKSAKH